MTDVKRSLKQLELAELARLAEAATPGPWECYGSTSNGGKTYAAVKLTRHPTTPHKTLSCDALFQAAANPQAVLGLIARIDELSARCAKLEEALEFYADPRTYEGGHNDDVGSAGIDIDYRGNTAREALKEET